MGKVIEAKPVNRFPKKRILKNNLQSKKRSQVSFASRKKPDIIQSYLRTLSNSFGPSTSDNSNTKRRIEDDGDQDTPPRKKQRILEINFPEKIDYTIEDDIKFEYLTKNLEYTREKPDLFQIDEARSSNEYTYYVEWLHLLCDEISLEGLDGITIEALWKRIEDSSHYPVLIEGKEDILWNLLKIIDQIQYFVLENPRGNLMIYDKHQYVCPDTGVVLEPEIDFGEIYPYAMVNKDGVRGSCATYNTRLDKTAEIRNLSLAEALNQYGNRLVLVASQKMRERAIMNGLVDPKVELSDNEYGLLERVGRARGYGELTQGKVSVLNIIKDSRSVFHVRKSLEGKKLLKKQFFVLRNAATGQNKTGKLLHLPRFYRLQKSKTLLLVESVVEFLRQQPGYSVEFGEFKKYFPRSTGINKILKTPEFTRYIKTDIFHPYRYLYPNAKVSEWRYKNRNKEKTLRLFQLIDPTVNVAATWNKTVDNEDHLEEEEIDDGNSRGTKNIDNEYLREIFSFIFKAGKEGITLQELVKKVNFDFYTVRIAVRKLQVRNVIDSVRSEKGKQRHIYYFARCFHSKDPPTPVKKTFKIPESILQKIIRDKKTSTKEIKKYNPLLNKRDKHWRNPNFRPFHCPLLARKDDAVDPPKEEVKKRVRYHPPVVFSKPITIDLPDIRILPKFCTIESTCGDRKIVWKFAGVKEIVFSSSTSNIAVKRILLKCILDPILSVTEMIQLDNNSDRPQEGGMYEIDFELATSSRRDYSSHYMTSKDFLLGSNPVQVSHEKTKENIDIIITQSTPPEVYLSDHKTYVSFDKNITALSLTRTNMILDEINRNHIICDIYKIQKAVNDQESALDKKNGQGRMDKSTMHRILLRLVNEGYIKIYKIFMMSMETFRTLWIVAHPSVELTHPLLHAAKEQAMIKFFLGMDAQILKSTENEVAKKESGSRIENDDVKNELDKLNVTNTKLPAGYKYNRVFGRTLGYQPKFVRMQLFHELIHYLVYDYKSLDQLTRFDVDHIFLHYRPEEIKSIPPIYQRTIDWKMFIPKLPLPQNYPSGWALLCDVILSIPLSVWVKIFHLSIECPDLLVFLKHPIRQHYLIKDIPLNLRQVLMHRRKYIFNAVELIDRLCYIGLMQLGPHNVLKDQLYLYVNKKASLLDTSTSGESYHKVTEKNYPRLSFTFSSSGDVEDYWCQLWTISMNTSLGNRKIMDGQSVAIEVPAHKSILSDCIKSKTPEEAMENDNGVIPGDQRGAGGLDSSMWSHIKRNWLWCSTPIENKSNVQVDKPSIREANIASIKPVAIKYKELMRGSSKIFVTNTRKPIPIRSSTKPKLKKGIIHRQIKIRKLKEPKKKEEMDAKDKVIIKKNGSIFKAKFDEEEDRILCICRAANYFLCRKSNVFKASRFLIRDILHILCPQSQNKTSGACARRINRLEHIDTFVRSLGEHAYELINIKELSTYFTPIIFNLSKTSLESSTSYSSFNTMEKNVAFVHVVWYIYQNYDKIKNILRGESKRIDHLNPANISTFRPLLVNIKTRKSVFNDPSSQADIEKEAVRAVLMSALHCSKQGQNISYQFFQICKKYSDQNIRSAVSSSKSYQAISYIKKSTRSTNSVKPIPFQLSNTYNHMQKSAFNCLCMQTIYHHFREICQERPGFADIEEIKNIFTYTRLIATNEATMVWPEYKIDINCPEASHMLRPYSEEQGFLVRKLAELYQRYLKERISNPENPLKKALPRDTRISMAIVDPSKSNKGITMMKLNVKRLFAYFPCYLCNETITSTIPQFWECKEEDQIIKYLQIFLDELHKIVLNLFSSIPDGDKLLMSYINKYYRHKKIDTYYKELEFKIFKLAFVTKKFLLAHDLSDVVQCSENKAEEMDEKILQMINKWMDKGKMKQYEEITNKDDELLQEQTNAQSFFKYSMAKDVSEVKIIRGIEDVPEIEEIVQGMLEAPTNFKRNIPHVSDVVCVLSQEKYPLDEQKLIEDLIDEFVLEYPTAKNFELEELGKFKRIYRYLFSDKQLPDLITIVNRYCHVKEGNTVQMIQKLKELGGTESDNLLAGEIIGFTYNQKFMGVTGSQIVENFSSKQRNLDLHVIVEVLCENSILYEVGVKEKTFVHFEHSDPWLVETFLLSPHEKHLLHASVKDELQILQQKIQTRIQSSKPLKVIMMPWLHLDGTLNGPLLQKWLTIVLSFCLENPRCSFEKLFERFYLIKPVELHFILKILEELKCLKICAMAEVEEGLWKDNEDEEEEQEEEVGTTRRAHILDCYANMFIEVNPLATTSLGHYLSRIEPDSC